MIALFCLFLTLSVSPFKSKSRLEAENAALRHQLIVLQRRVRGRVQLTNGDRLFLVQLYRWFPSVLRAITIIRPETLVRWHRAGFRRYWRWKSRSLGGRPQIAADLRALIRQMSAENPLWGAPRIHGELLKLGFDVAQSTVSKYMLRDGEVRRLKGGRLFSATTPTGLHPWISSSFRRWHSNAVAFYGSASRPIRRRNGWPARLPKPFLGTLFRAFSSVTMMVPLARRSLGGFEQWAFAIAP